MRNPPAFDAPRIALALVALLATVAPAAIASREGDAGYRLLDPRATVRVLATLPGESLAQVVVDPAGRLFLGGREGVFVVEASDVKPGLELTTIYRQEGDHWFMGLVPRGDDLYVAKHDAILVLPGAVTKRASVTPRQIVWGFPRAKGWAFHQTLHDLKVGPDGKLYVSMGDPAWSFGDFRRPDHWFQTRIETAGTPATRDITSVGGLFRFDAGDGSNLELVATGTRNNNGFDWNAAFDLMTTDNDHEQDSRYVPSRLLFVVAGGHYNWPRGWMEDRPDNLPALAGMGREVPVGLAVYDDARLPEDYRGNILVARWGQGKIDRFAPSREGSGYKAREIPWLVCPPGRRPMAVAVGRGGRVYAVVSHMETNAESPTYTADLLEIDAAGGEPGFSGYETATASVDHLYGELSRPDLSRRMPAHVELARRGDAAVSGIADRMGTARPDDPALPHLVRLAGLSEGRESLRRLVDALRDTHEDVRYHAVHALAGRSGPPWIDLWGLFKDPSPRVRRAVLTALAGSKERPPLVALEETSRLARSTDPYVRHLAARLLARNLGPENPHPLLADPDEDPVPPPLPAGRLAAVLADGYFLTIPPADGPLPTALELAPSAYEEPPRDGRRRLGMFTIDAWWRALDKTPAHEAAFRRLVAALGDHEPVVRLQALRSLDRLGDPRTVPGLEGLVDSARMIDAATLDQALVTLGRLGGPKAVDRIVAVLATAQGSTRRAAAEALVALDLPADENSVAMTAALDRLAKTGGIDDATRQAAVRRLATPDLLRTLVLDRQTAPMLRGTALERLATLLDASTLGEVVAQVEPTASSRLLGPAAGLAATKLEPGLGLRLLGTWLESPSEDARRAAAQAIAASKRDDLIGLARARLAAETAPVVLKPLAEAVLGSAKPDAERDAALAALARSRPDLDAGLRARLIEHLRGLPGYLGIAGEAARPMLAEGKIPAAFAGIDWTQEWRAGDPERGRALFRATTGVSCVACHRFRGEGGQNGPSLEEADKRLSAPYMAGSILAPGAQIAPQYLPWAIALKSGEVLTGIILQEGSKALTLGMTDGTTRELALADIDERKAASTSIMPEGLVKTPQELRDLLAYLLTPGPH